MLDEREYVYVESWEYIVAAVGIGRGPDAECGAKEPRHIDPSLDKICGQNMAV